MGSGALVIEGGQPAVEPGSHGVWPQFGKEEQQAALAVLDGDAADLGGPNSRHARGLEEDFAEYCGVRHCRAVASATDGLVAALVAAGVGRGTRVIVPAMGFVATPQAVALTGAKIDWCDIDPDTFNIDATQAESLIRRNTRAIVPVHAHGLMADMDSLRKVAGPGTATVEDAAQAAGGTQDGRMAGTVGRLGVFSLNVQKPFQAGDGGLVITNDADVARMVIAFTNWGENETIRPGPGETAAHWSRGLGGTSRVHPIAAALARVQLKRLPGFLDVGERNAQTLLRSLAELPGFVAPYIPPGHRSTYHMIRVRLDPAAWGWEGDPRELRDRVTFALRMEGVEVRVWGIAPLPMLPAFRRGKVTPWRPGVRRLKRWDSTRYPVTSRLLDTSFVLGRVPYPLHVQSEELIKSYIRAFEKLVERRSVVLTAEYEPLRVVPAIPDEER